MWKEAPRTRKKEVLFSHFVESSHPSLTTVSLEVQYVTKPPCRQHDVTKPHCWQQYVPKPHCRQHDGTNSSSSISSINLLTSSYGR